jgi:hypothetical protein
MKRLTLLKYWSNEAFNASSLSTLYEFKPKSANNLWKSKDDYRLYYENMGNVTIFFEIANINQRFIASLRYYFFAKALR